VAYRLSPDLEAAADVTQEVFLAAVKGWKGYRGDGSPLTWLRAIARHKVADHLRARLRRPAQLSPEALPAAVPEEEAGRRATLIAGVMRSLPDGYAELLEEKYLEGLSVGQIARHRRSSEKAVESSLTRARRAFREGLLKLRAKQESPK
jgi:RNA polymerase sigma-70 factor (ECF subfamily)